MRNTTIPANHRIYQAEGREHVAYERHVCARCGSDELCRMSDNPHYGWLCVRCTPIWYRCGQQAATDLFTSALVKWCFTIVDNSHAVC